MALIRDWRRLTRSQGNDRDASRFLLLQAVENDFACVLAREVEMRVRLAFRQLGRIKVRVCFGNVGKAVGTVLRRARSAGLSEYAARAGRKTSGRLYSLGQEFGKTRRAMFALPRYATLRSTSGYVLRLHDGMLHPR